MKVCVLSPGVVHAVPRTLAFAGAFDEVHFVDVPGTADRARLEAAGVRYHRPGKLRRLLARIAPDAIVCHYASGDHFFGAVAFGGCPVAVIAMGNDILYDDGDTRVPALAKALVRAGLASSAYVAAKSRVLADAARRLGYRGALEVNYWGSDLARYAPGDRIAARRALGLPPDALVVLSPRAIDPLYNVPMIVEAFAQLVSSHPRSLLVVLGRSTPASRASVEAAVARLGLGAQVRIVGEVGEAALLDWYRASDVAVSAAAVEGFPNTVLELMACGVPLVAGDIAQLRELLADGVSARLVAIDAAAIGAAIADLAGNPSKAAALAARAREIALREGDLLANGRRFAAAISGLRQPPRGFALARFRALYALHRVTRALC